jgi:hypothetical protein
LDKKTSIAFLSLDENPNYIYSEESPKIYTREDNGNNWSTLHLV